jgi:hypothetical protein
MKFSILYGIDTANIDVTEIAMNKCLIRNRICIPSGEQNRANLFTDPLPNVLKIILIRDNDTGIVTYYDHTKRVCIDIDNAQLEPGTTLDTSKLNDIHAKLTLKYGSFREEYPEQLMAATYLTGNENVLEIGGNIGRNSLVIAFILNQMNNSNFVCLECDPDIAKKLTENRDINNLQFHIEATALSKRPLIQQGWTSC